MMGRNRASRIFARLLLNRSLYLCARLQVVLSIATNAIHRQGEIRSDSGHDDSFKGIKATLLLRELSTST